MMGSPDKRGQAPLEAGFSDHVGQLLPAYLNGTLDPADGLRIRNHVASCAFCAADLANWQAVGCALREDLATFKLPSDHILDNVLAEIDRTPRAAPGPRRLAPQLTTFSSDMSWNERITTMSQPESRPNRSRILRPLAAVAAAAALAALVILTPIGSYAEGFLTIFTPQQFAAVAVTQSELQSLPDLNSYGTFTQNRGVKAQEVTSAAAASAATGMTVLVPGALPASIPTPASYNITNGQSASFTFSAAKAQAAAKGKPLPAMPANIDGSSIQVTTGAAVLAVYADDSKFSSTSQAQSNKGSSTVSRSNLTSTESAASAVESMGPFLVIGQTTTPVVTSNGVSAAQLEQYLLAQPGISPDLASAIRAIGDPSTTMPIPIPVDRASSHSVQVQGVSGLAVADSTGLGGGVVWTKNGIIYGVAGSLNESDLIAIANSLH